MNIFAKRNIAVGLVALLVGIFGFAAIAKAWNRSETVTGNIAAFILNPEGKLDGAILSTGDQVHFGAETGALVAQQVKVGDGLTATGHVGYKTDYGRQMRAEAVRINDQTITVVHAKPPQKGEHGDKGRPMPPHEKGERGERDRPMPPALGQKPELAPSNNENPADNHADAQNGAPPAAPAPRETVTANGSVKWVLVGARGEARGLILSDNAQVMLPRAVEKADLTFNQETVVSATGDWAKSDFGMFVRPTALTIGNKTFSFNR